MDGREHCCHLLDIFHMVVAVSELVLVDKLNAVMLGVGLGADGLDLIAGEGWFVELLQIHHQ